MIDLKKYGINYMLVNSTNKFLLEYVPIEENACYSLTKFTGEVGDVLVSSNGKNMLFVDSRFHIQADLEVDTNVTEVIKLEPGQKKDTEISLKILPNTTLGVNPETISQKRYETLKKLLDKKQVKIKFINQKSNCRFGNIIKVDKSKIDLIKQDTLITNSEELSYILGIRCFSYNYSTKVDGKLLIINGEYILFSDYKGENVRPLSEFELFIKNLDNIPLHVDKSTINAKDYSLIKNPVEIISPIKLIKSIKTSKEIEHFKHCFDMTDKALKATRDWIYENDDISEYDIKENLENNFKKFGAKSLSFASIVAINENSALAHYNKTDKTKILKDGDLVLIDCGAYYDKGFATDITRVFVKGEPSELQKQVYTTVLKVFLNCYNYQITNKTTGFEIDKLAHLIFDNNKIDGFEFSHGLGHGVGISVHETPPNLSKNDIAKTKLENNMVFTIEPGLYKKNMFGIRLENTCYLKDKLITSFTNMCFEKKLIDYDFLTNMEKDYLNKFEVC